jgi:hypothetical protein
LVAAFVLSNCASVPKTDSYKTRAGFLVYDDPKYCFFLEVKDSSVTNDCLKTLIQKTSKEAILVPHNWIGQIKNLMPYIDTIRVTNVPEGFNTSLYSLHYIPVIAKLQVLYEKGAERNKYTYKFENGQLHFFARHWVKYDIEIRPTTFCK